MTPARQARPHPAIIAYNHKRALSPVKLYTCCSMMSQPSTNEKHLLALDTSVRSKLCSPAGGFHLFWFGDQETVLFYEGCEE